MPNVAYDDYESKVWTALLACIQAEINIGASGPGTGTNPNGRLQTCADLRKSIHLFTGRLPAIGVQSLGYKSERYSTHHDLLTISFHIIVAANSMPNGATPANMDDANANLQPLVSDGLGNGLGPILRDPVNFALAPYVAGISETWLSGLERSWEVKDGQDAQVIAYGLFMYEAKLTAYTGK